MAVRSLTSYPSNNSNIHNLAKQLDATQWSYPKWWKDKFEAAHAYYFIPKLFAGRLESMRRKQALYDGDGRHPNLVKLLLLDTDADTDAACVWTYPQWQKDVEDAQVAHCMCWQTRFEDKVEAMKKKQALCNGDRSHFHLEELDGISWSYPKWQADMVDAEEAHWRWPTLFASKVETMKKKQAIHEGDRSHANLRRLDTVSRSYLGWRADKADAEEIHCRWPTSFDTRLKTMHEKQAIHDDGEQPFRPTAQELDAISWLYPDWRKTANADKEEARCYERRSTASWFANGLKTIAQKKQAATEAEQIRSRRVAHDIGNNDENHHQNAAAAAHQLSTRISSADDKTTAEGGVVHLQTTRNPHTAVSGSQNLPWRTTTPLSALVLIIQMCLVLLLVKSPSTAPH